LINYNNADRYLIGFSVELDLVTLHHLLNGGADVAKPDVDSGGSDTGLGRLKEKFRIAVKQFKTVWISVSAHF
jgi:hypothetical protein